MIAISLLTLVAAGCGDDDSDSPATPTRSPNPTSTSPPSPASTPTVVTPTSAPTVTASVATPTSEPIATPTEAAPTATATAAATTTPFEVVEATIEQIQAALLSREITTTDLVEAYLERIKAYNGTCVNQPEGVLGPITTIPNAGQVNALMTLNLRPASRIAWGFDERKARSMTDLEDDDPNMPDALEVAAAQDAQFETSGQLVGPLHGVVMALKDQYDTFDMRTTQGADAFFANDRPPDDATFASRLRAAGAIILAKANMGEYASGDRSSFGGVTCNPYDTERSPGRSSGGSGAAVAANLVTCAIGEESGGSVVNPTRHNNLVGLPATIELVSRDGMYAAQPVVNDRIGPMCRTVEDVARILTVIAGYDPKDAVTAFSIGRMPSAPYQSFATGGRLEGVRIGVLREYMNKTLFTEADFETIDVVDSAIDDLRELGATIVDPGPTGALFQDCIDQYVPVIDSKPFMAQFPDLFPFDENGDPAADHISTLIDMYMDPTLVPHLSNGRPNIRNLGSGGPNDGAGRFKMDYYLRERGDTNIRSVADLIEKSNFFTDIREGSGFSDKRNSLAGTAEEMTLDQVSSMARHHVLQVIALQCFALQDLDAVLHPTTNIPAPKLGAPTEPNRNDRGQLAWNLLPGSASFPILAVPAGFTTHVYDRDPDMNLVGPVPAVLPVGVSFLGKPFDEPMLFRIASAYEAATHHRTPPSGFGPLPK
jgi:Asp-tRNA(Asn)/Glu-tRNA(Gln) amidotransferase A subunit family amidase